MIPFQVAEALRRARRRRGQPAPRRRSRVSTWRLLVDELALLVAWVACAPATAVLAAGLTTAVGVHVALGPSYPGPVAPDAARWVLVSLVVAAAVALARTAPTRWSDARHAVGRSRLLLAVPGVAATVCLVKVGLHEMTPGPVLAAPWRWGAVVLAVTAAVAYVRDRHHDGAAGS